jgi:hypothetical protein
MKLVNITINKYRIYGEPKVKLLFKPLLKRPVLDVIRIRVNGKTCGLLVGSKKNNTNITNIDFIWVNRKRFKGVNEDTESTFYQTLYDVFMQWNNHPKGKIAIALNITKEQQVERFRRILTLYGFEIDPQLSMQDVTFKTPYRDREPIEIVVYSRAL